MDSKLKAKLSSKNKWIKALYILLFLAITFIVKLIIWFITAFQFITVLFTDHPNKMLLEFSEHLSVYIAQIFRFLAYNTEEKPYPFSALPGKKIEIKHISAGARRTKKRGK
jgi:hypothetical protein